MLIEYQEILKYKRKFEVDKKMTKKSKKLIFPKFEEKWVFSKILIFRDNLKFCNFMVLIFVRWKNY